MGFGKPKSPFKKNWSKWIFPMVAFPILRYRIVDLDFCFNVLLFLGREKLKMGWSKVVAEKIYSHLSDFKYLNDKGTRGALNDTVTNIRGVVVPAGVSSVYDEQLGKNLKRPFLHVRYRASQTDDRKMKTWVTGSVGASTSALDAMQIHMLSERCLVTQGANNFMLLK